MDFPNCFAILCFLWILRRTVVIGQEFKAYPPGTILLDNDGGYAGILVAIDHNVQFQSAIISNIQGLMTDLSNALQAATRPIAERFIKDVTILLPADWPAQPQCRNVSQQLQAIANIIVYPTSGQNDPYTVRYDSQCGKSSGNIVIPEDFLSRGGVGGDTKGKVLLKQWAQLRYGIFDETFATNTNSEQSTCLLFEGDAVFPIHCSVGLQGRTEITKGGGSCTFTPSYVQNESVMASILYTSDINQVTTFCDGNGTTSGVRHNFAVPNEHNDRCDGRSAWEVLRSLQDFDNRFKRQAPNPPNSKMIEFRCVQQTKLPRIVLTMDVSGSMASDDRLERMITDVRLFIEGISCENTLIGLVQFSSNTSTTYILHDLVSVQSPQNVQSLVAALPNKTTGATCIGCGIAHSLEVLQKAGSVVGGAIVVFTDGMENEHPSINDVSGDVVKNGVIVYSIILSEVATDNPLLNLVTSTGGKSCIFSNSQQSTYYDCLNSILTDQLSYNAPIQILNSVRTVPRGSEVTGTIEVDTELTLSLLLSITWDQEDDGACADTDVTLISPSFRELNSRSSMYRYSSTLRMISFDMSKLEAGTWTYDIFNRRGNASCTMRLLLQGRQPSCTNAHQNPPAIMKTTVDPPHVVLTPENTPHENAIRLYARLTKGNKPVIFAQVTAEIEVPNQPNPVVLELWDNGAGADYRKNDGIYSRYFLNYTGSGPYGVKFQAFANGSAKVEFPSSRKRRSTKGNTPDFIPVAPFQRASSGSYFQVANIGTIGSSKQQLFPPSKIVDLKITALNLNLQQVSLTWTAIGKHLDHERASFYDVRISEDISLLRESTNTAFRLTNDYVEIGDITQASGSGDTEGVTFTFYNKTWEPTPTVPYYICIRAVNSFQSYGPPSNVVLFMLSNQAPSTFGLKPYIFFVIAFSILAALIVLAALTCIICRLKRASKKVNSKTEDSDSSTSKNSVETTHTDLSAGDAEVGKSPSIGGLRVISYMDQTSAKTRPTSIPHASLHANRSNGEIPTKMKRAARLYVLREKAQGNNKNTHRKCDDEEGQSAMNNKKLMMSTPMNEQTSWNANLEPFQNHPYSNPLFGQSALSPEIEVRNSIITK